MIKWTIRIEQKCINRTPEFESFIRKLTHSGVAHISTTIEKNVVVQIFDMSNEALHNLFSIMPLELHNRMMDVGRRNHDSMVAGSVSDKDGHNGTISLLNQRNEFLYAHQGWHRWNAYPLEPTKNHFARLVDLIPVQTVMGYIQRVSLQANLNLDEGFSIVVDDYCFSIHGYILALKYRERRKVEPAVERLLRNSKKIRELTKTNNEIVLGTDLKTCK